MQAGKYKVRITGCFTGESAQKKTPFYGLEFTNEQGECIDHIAYLAGENVERNLETLLKLGYAGRSLADMSDVKKKVADLFPPIQDPIFITVEDEEYTNSEGLARVKQVVKWVNVGNAGPARFDHKQAVVKFGGLTFDGDLARLRGQVAKPAPAANAPASNSQAQGQQFTADDIPF